MLARRYSSIELNADADADIKQYMSIELMLTLETVKEGRVDA